MNCERCECEMKYLGTTWWCENCGALCHGHGQMVYPLLVQEVDSEKGKEDDTGED